jgi:hypothetical protein
MLPVGLMPRPPWLEPWYGGLLLFCFSCCVPAGGNVDISNGLGDFGVTMLTPAEAEKYLRKESHIAQKYAQARWFGAAGCRLRVHSCSGRRARSVHACLLPNLSYCARLFASSGVAFPLGCGPAMPPNGREKDQMRLFMAKQKEQRKRAAIGPVAPQPAGPGPTKNMGARQRAAAMRAATSPGSPAEASAAG